MISFELAHRASVCHTKPHVPHPSAYSLLGRQHLQTALTSTRNSQDAEASKPKVKFAAHMMHSNGGPIAGTLNWLSNTAFGAGASGTDLGAWYRKWLRHGSQRPHSHDETARPPPQTPPEVITSLARIMLVSEHRMQKLAAAYPQVLSMPQSQVAARLVVLKELLPGVDVARMVELTPGLLLGASIAELQAAKQQVDFLVEHLPGADVAFMIQEDPGLMFEELSQSLPRFYELWPGLDASALAASDPKHLALALRALSRRGPPKRF